MSAFGDLARRRKMTRHFLNESLDDVVLQRVLDTARRVPSAGNSQGFDFVVLRGPNETARYWDVALPADRRESFRWTSLLACPVLITVWADPTAYIKRYGEPDKQPSEADKQPRGLGSGADAWPVPYWIVDASFAAMALQYAAIDEGLGVLFFGMFNHAPAVAAALGVPTAHEAVGVIALGWPDRAAETASGPAASQNRPRRPLISLKQSHSHPEDHPDEGPPATIPPATSPPNTGTPAASRPVVHGGRWLGHW